MIKNKEWFVFLKISFPMIGFEDYGNVQKEEMNVVVNATTAEKAFQKVYMSLLDVLKLKSEKVTIENVFIIKNN